MVGFFKKNLIFCYFEKNRVFAKISWLNFHTKHVFIILSKKSTILLKSFLAIFSQL